jgi:serine/threonine protein kinase
MNVYIDSLYKSTSIDDTYITVHTSDEDIVDTEKRLNPLIDLKRQANLLSYNTKREIPRALFSITEEIGSGNFGNVSLGELSGLYGPSSKTPVAIKSINGPAEGNNLRDFLQEIKIMSYIRPHLNLVSMIGSSSSDLGNNREMWLVLELCSHGDLKSFLVKNKREILSGEHNKSSLNDRYLIQWAHDIAKGMKYLSTKKIMHGDLAARNVLLSHNPVEGGRLIAKVADFGLSKRFYDKLIYEKESRVLIPWKWMALEYLSSDVFMLNSDVWSFGVVLWEILSFGRAPYADKEYDEVLTDLETGYRLPCPLNIQNVTSWSPERFYNEVSNVCFKAEPNNRGSFTDVVNIIEASLSQDEIVDYSAMKQKYEESCCNNYLRLGQRNTVKLQC